MPLNCRPRPVTTSCGQINVLALCGDGDIVVDIARGTAQEQHAVYPVKSFVVREQLDDIKRHAQAAKVRSGAPGALAFGCLPLEETVAVYTMVQAAWHVFSMGLMVYMGTQAVHHMTPIELFQNVVGAAVSIVALLGISGHREARRAVKEAAFSLGARWEAELDVAFDSIRMEPQAPEWLRLLHRGAEWVRLLVLWSPVDLLFDMPILGSGTCAWTASTQASCCTAGSPTPCWSAWRWRCCC